LQEGRPAATISATSGSSVSNLFFVFELNNSSHHSRPQLNQHQHLQGKHLDNMCESNGTTTAANGTNGTNGNNGVSDFLFAMPLTRKSTVLSQC